MTESFKLLGFEDGGWGYALLKGTWVTLQISVGAFIIGIMIGFFTAMVKLHGNKPARTAAKIYTTICRAVPELLLILLLFYGSSHLISKLLASLGHENVDISGTAIAVFVLSLAQGAYASEIIRGAILAVNSGQIEAAQAYGMPPGKTFIRVTLPMMAPYALAGLSNLWIILIKDSALVSVVGTNELLYTAKQAGGSTREYLLFYGAAAAIYYVITLVSSYFLRLLENSLRRWQPRAS